MKFSDLIVFGKEQLTTRGKFSYRGKDSATMYFLIPKHIKDRVKTKKGTCFTDCGIVMGEKKEEYLVIRIK